MKSSCCTFAILCIPLLCLAQLHDNSWLLGYSGGSSDTTFGITRFTFPDYTLRIINNQTDPTTVHTDINFWHSNASISDASGDLLFYYDGHYVEDRRFQLMANGYINGGIGSGIGADNLPQGGLILPYPGQDNQYLLMHGDMGYIDIDGWWLEGDGLYYSVIDMEENNGFGQIMIKKEPLLVDTIQAGKVTATRHANGRDWWILINERVTNKYYNILISPTGPQLLAQQQIVTDTIVDEYGQGLFSPDGNFYVAFNSVSDSIGNYLDIFDFDRCTGQMSNQRHLHLDGLAIGGGVAISLNSRFLYVAAGVIIYQFDLWASGIAQSRVTVAEWDGFFHTFGVFSIATTFNQMQLAPDGKIYLSCTNGVPYVHVINYPNRPGLSCGVAQHGINLPTYNAFSVPNHPNYRLGPIDGSDCDTLGIDNMPLAAFRCNQDTVDALFFNFTDLSSYEPAEWLWDFGDGTFSQEASPIHLFPAFENYEVCLTVSNENGEDTYCKTVYLGTTGTDETTQQDRLNVYPNPASDVIYLDHPDILYWEKTELINMTGHVVRSSRYNNMLTVADLPDGVYVLRLWKDGKRWVRKVVLN